MIGTTRRTYFEWVDDPEAWDPGDYWGTPALYTEIMDSLLADNGAAIGVAHALGIESYHDYWKPRDEHWWDWDAQLHILYCSCVTGDPSLRREGAQQISYTGWTRNGWYIFSLPANPCEPGQSRLFGGYPIPLSIFDPALGQWVLYSGDLDPDHAYRAWGPLAFSYYACHATVDQYISLDCQGTPWIGTARNLVTNTSNWRVTATGCPPKTLGEAVLMGWIDDDLAYFDNQTGQEVGFKVTDSRDIQPRNGVKIQVLTTTDLTLMIPVAG